MANMYNFKSFRRVKDQRAEFLEQSVIKQRKYVIAGELTEIQKNMQQTKLY